MIENLVSFYPAIVNRIIESDIKFYQTGSRYFGTSTDDSDWDFFADDTIDTRRWLTDHGFICLSFYADNNEYNIDPFCNAVYRQGKVDVQLVNNLDLKIKAQDLIKNKINVNWLRNKTIARVVWFSALSALDSMVEKPVDMVLES